MNTIVETIFLLGSGYFSIGLSHWLLYNNQKRIDFFVAAQILAVSYLVFAIQPVYLGLVASLIFVVFTTVLSEKLNPWKNVKGFIASLALFTILISSLQIAFGTIPKMGQIQNEGMLIGLVLLFSAILFGLWFLVRLTLQARFDNKKRTFLIQELNNEKIIFAAFSSIVILIAGIEYLWTYNASIENAFRIGIIGSILTLSAKSVPILAIVAIALAAIEMVATLFFPSGYRDIIPMIVLIGVLYFRRK